MITLFTYYVSVVIVFLGLYCGVFLGFIAEEEIKPGKKYMHAFLNVLLTLIALTIIWFLKAPWIVLVICMVLLYYLFHLITKKSMFVQIAYFLFGVLVFASTISKEFFLISSSLMFLSGFPIGSMYVLKKLNESRSLILTDIITSYGFYLVIAFVFSFYAVLMNSF